MNVKLHRSPPFRAERLGPLLRPEIILQARADVEQNKVDKQPLEIMEDDAVKEIVKLQLDLGFHPISDGEYRRHSNGSQSLHW